MSLNLCCENIFLIGAKLLQLEILSLKLSAMWNFKVCTDWSKLIMLNENWKQTWEQEYANEFKMCQSSDFGWITSNPRRVWELTVQSKCDLLCSVIRQMSKMGRQGYLYGDSLIKRNTVNNKTLVESVQLGKSSQKRFKDFY